MDTIVALPLSSNLSIVRSICMKTIIEAITNAICIFFIRLAAEADSTMDSAWVKTGCIRDKLLDDSLEVSGTRCNSGDDGVIILQMRVLLVDDWTVLRVASWT